MAGMTPVEKISQSGWPNSAKPSEVFALFYNEIVKPMEDRIAALETKSGKGEIDKKAKNKK